MTAKGSLDRLAMRARPPGSPVKIRIYHPPWILEEAQVTMRSSTLLSTLGIPEPTSEPLAHFSKSLDVGVWPPVPVRASARQEGIRVPST